MKLILYGTLIHSNDMNSNYVTTNFSRNADEKYVQYIGAYYYKWNTDYDGKDADRVFGLDMLAPLPDKLSEEEAYLLYLLSKSSIKYNKKLNLFTFYFNIELNTDTARHYLSSKYLRINY